MKKVSFYLDDKQIRILEDIAQLEDKPFQEVSKRLFITGITTFHPLLELIINENREYEIREGKFILTDWNNAKKN